MFTLVAGISPNISRYSLPAIPPEQRYQKPLAEVEKEENKHILIQNICKFYFYILGSYNKQIDFTALTFANGLDHKHHKQYCLILN